MRLVFALSLMLAAAPAWAEWIDVAQSVSAVVYMDPGTLTKEGNHRKAWVLYNFRKRARTLSISSFPESMAGGAVLSKNETPDEWQDVAPKSVNGIQLDYACSK